MSEGKISAAIVRLSDLFESGRLQASLAPDEFIHQVADEIVKLRQQSARLQATLFDAQQALLREGMERDNALVRAEQAEAALAAVPVAAIETVALWALQNGAPDHVSSAAKGIAGWRYDAPAKPSPVVAFAELREKYHQYFDCEPEVQP